MGPSLHMRKSAHIVHTNPETKTELSENALQTEGIWPCVLVWTENILKTELFENNDFTIIL